MAFVLVVPFLVGIVICTVSSILLWSGIATKAVTIVIGMIASLIGIVVVAFSFIIWKADSVSIICSSDGPTSVFLAGKVNPWSLIIELVVGFVLLNPYSSIGKNPDFTIAEFTIFPAYRRKHIAIEAAKAILDKHPGIWEIKYTDKNEKAKRLWNTVAAPYGPKVVPIEDDETVLTFSTEIG